MRTSTVDCLPPWDGRAIILLDLDAFFASVEQLDNPDWRGKPLIVGGDPKRRGVVSTCSYEARKFGVHSAMPSSQAARLCPDAIWTPGNFDRYREVSAQVMSFLVDETPYVQQVSIDEAFADITPTRINKEHPLSVANRIQSKVSELGITCSIGLSTSMSVSKIASDIEKPNGLTVVYPGSEVDFLRDMPCRALSFIGRAAEEKLLTLGFQNLGQLAQQNPEDLRTVFGSRAEIMIARARGEDFSELELNRPVKSVSHEKSYAEDISDKDLAEGECQLLLAHVGRRLRKKGLKGRTLTLKVRYEDRSVRTAQSQIPEQTDDDIALRPLLSDLFEKLWSPIYKVRLLGVAVSGFDKAEEPEQSELFSDSEEKHFDASNSSLLSAFDALNDKFGEGAITYGSALRDIE